MEPIEILWASEMILFDFMTANNHSSPFAHAVRIIDCFRKFFTSSAKLKARIIVSGVHAYFSIRRKDEITFRINFNGSKFTSFGFCSGRFAKLQQFNLHRHKQGNICLQLSICQLIWASHSHDITPESLAKAARNHKSAPSEIKPKIFPKLTKIINHNLDMRADLFSVKISQFLNIYKDVEVARRNDETENM